MKYLFFVLIIFCFLFQKSFILGQTNLLPITELNKQKKFSSIDDALKNKESVYILSLSNQALKSIPEGLYQLNKIQYLDLRNNQLTAIPKEILQLKNLQFLILSGNSLTSVPAYIASLSELKVLDLGNNKISALPPVIGNLLKLEELSIENNRFQKMPAEICKITPLKILKIWDNPFAEIPNSICKIEKLEELFINSDQLVGVIGSESAGLDPKTNAKQCIIEEEGDDNQNGGIAVKSSIAGLKKLHIRKKGLTVEQQKTIEKVFKTTKIIYY